jgi:hypothetical protein
VLINPLDLLRVGGAAEFAAIRAVDRLFFSGRLPDARIERLFESARFAQRVFFGDPDRVAHTIEDINRIHRRLVDLVLEFHADPLSDSLGRSVGRVCQRY